MKKILAVILFLLAISSISFAQRNRVEDDDRENFFRIGGKIGFDIDKTPGMALNDGFNFNYILGGFMQFNFSRRFGVQPEVNFVQATSSPATAVSDIFNDAFRDGTQKYAPFNYLEVPLLLNINVGVSRHVKLQVGPSYGHLLNQNSDSLRVKGYLYKNSELSMVGGFWIQLPFINLGARFQQGLNKVYGANDQSWHNQVITVFTGFTF